MPPAVTCAASRRVGTDRGSRGQFQHGCTFGLKRVILAAKRTKRGGEYLLRSRVLAGVSSSFVCLRQEFTCLNLTHRRIRARVFLCKYGQGGREQSSSWCGQSFVHRQGRCMPPRFCNKQTTRDNVLDARRPTSWGGVASKERRPPQISRRESIPRIFTEVGLFPEPTNRRNYDAIRQAYSHRDGRRRKPTRRNDGTRLQPYISIANNVHLPGRTRARNKSSTPVCGPCSRRRRTAGRCRTGSFARNSRSHRSPRRTRRPGSALVCRDTNKRKSWGM